MVAPEPTSFASDGRRLIVYRCLGTGFVVDEYVFLAVAGLSEFATRVVVEVPGPLEDFVRCRLAEVSADVVVSVRHDEGELGGWLDRCEREGLRFDEVVITDDSWFGPVAPLGPIFARMDPEPLHAWTMTPAGRPGSAAWVALRRPRDSSAAWADLLPATRVACVGDDGGPAAPVISGGGSVAVTGMVVGSAFASPFYPAPDPVVIDSHRLIADGCPLLSVRVFTSSPLLLERHAVIGRDILREVSERGYPPDAVVQHLARTVAPHRLNAALGLLDIPHGRGSSETGTPRVVVLAHFAQEEDSSELLRHISLIPGECDIVATTCVAGSEDGIRTRLLQARASGAGDIEVRRVPSTADHVSAVFVGCRDVLLDRRRDIVIAVHSGRAGGRSANTRRYLTRHTWDNLLASGPHASRMLALFRESRLGLVFPPTPHIGHDTLGAGWDGLLPDSARLARILGIGVPLGAAPLRPAGGMWFGRVEALRLLAAHPWSWEDYQPGAGWDDLGRTQESILAHAAGELGFHVRTVLTAEHAAISHAPLEYKLDQLASTTPGFPVDQVALLDRLGWVGSGSAWDFVRMHLRANHPALIQRLPLIARFARVRRPTHRDDRLDGGESW